MKTIWKPLPYELYKDTYQISNTGILRSVDRIIEIYNTYLGKSYPRFRKGIEKQIRHTKINPHLFTEVSVKIDGVQYIRTIYIHKAVGLAFIKNPDNKPFVSHIKPDFANNTPGNLKWTNKSEVSIKSMLDYPENRDKIGAFQRAIKTNRLNKIL